jgi:hypothetical protein
MKNTQKQTLIDISIKAIRDGGFFENKYKI